MESLYGTLRVDNSTLGKKKREEKENKPASLLSADVSASKHLHLKVFEHL